MLDIKKLEQMGMEQGFSHVALLDCDTIELKPEVRQMCASDTCHKYNKCWSCPPGCGSLEESLFRQWGNWKMPLMERA